jgi:PAT family beta-lactamase induction signal transducer AmpG
MNIKKYYYYFLFGLLYFVQGSALAYFRNFQKPYLNSVGVDAASIGLLTSILLLPFIIKIFIGMFSDKVSLFGLGHRKPYIVAGLLFGVASFAAVSFVLPDQNFVVFSILIVMASFGVALFDSATDGFAIDVTPEAEQGRVQGIMIGGRAFGFIILSLIFGFLVESAGYGIIFIIVAAQLALPLVFLAFTKKQSDIHEKQAFEWSAFGVMFKPHFLMFAVFAISYSFVSFGVDGLVTYFMSFQPDVDEAMIGKYGALRGVGAVMGAVAGGFFLDKIGRRRIAYSTVVIISLAAFLLATAESMDTILLLAVIWGFAWGFQETVFVAMAMGLSDARIAASVFAIMMALSNVGTAIVEYVATALSVDIGFQNVFAGLGVINGINILVLYLFFHFYKKTLGAADGKN